MQSQCVSYIEQLCEWLTFCTVSKLLLVCHCILTVELGVPWSAKCAVPGVFVRWPSFVAEWGFLGVSGFPASLGVFVLWGWTSVGPLKWLPSRRLFWNASFWTIIADCLTTSLLVWWCPWPLGFVVWDLPSCDAVGPDAGFVSSD